MDGRPMMTDTKARFLVFVCIVFASLAVVVAAGMYWNAKADGRRGDICEAVVEVRVDTRAMWVYLLKDPEHPNDPKVAAFEKALDERLPVLTCEDGHAVPTEEK
jgi:hypothetical protein